MKDRVILYQIFTRLFGNKKTKNKPWGTLEENGVGKFNDISKTALKEIHKMGITHVWYTGVIEHALLTDYTQYGISLDDADIVKGRAGSPYAIKDYYDVNPDLAKSVPDRMREFEELLKRTHKQKMKVIIDFVPNHVARQYHSDAKPKGVRDFGEDDDRRSAFSPNNNFYYIPGESFQVPANYNSLQTYDFPNKDTFFNEKPAKATGNDVFSPTPSIDDWFETAKLNYGVDYLNGHSKHFDPIPDTWLKMKDILLYWAKKGVDGFRCDMAEMVPVEFWEWVIKEVKVKYPELVFIAEVYEPSKYRDYIFQGGFDYLYDKVELYDTLKAIIQDSTTADAITHVWQNQEGIGDHMLRFLENHDEQRIASPEFAGDMWPGIPMMAVTAFMHKGPVMIYFGQEVGEPAEGHSGLSGDDGRTTIFDYWGVPEFVKWVNNHKYDGGLLSDDQNKLRQGYIEILQKCNELEAFRNGEFFDLQYYNHTESFYGYPEKTYSFIRHYHQQVLLVIVNLAEESAAINLKIPEAAWEATGIQSDRVNIRKPDGSDGNYSRNELTDHSSSSGFQTKLAPYSYGIYSMAES